LAQVAESVPQKLQDALDERGLSVRAFAKQFAGRGASPKQIESKRRQLSKWLAGAHEPSDASARKLERALKMPAGYFVTVRRRRGDRLDDLEARMERIEARLEEALRERAVPAGGRRAPGRSQRAG
jgi:transcriptional regulator with XRE-family HTH domain